MSQVSNTNKCYHRLSYWLAAQTVKIGYARISTKDQSLQLQIDALNKAGCIDDKIFTDVGSGSLKNRQGLEQALSYLREGDVLVIWRLDRLGRSVRNLIELLDHLRDRGVGLLSLTESLDTTTAMGQAMFHVTAMFAELERNVIIERTNAGLAAARARGRLGGRKNTYGDEFMELVKKEVLTSSKTIDEICKDFGISRRTYYRRIEQNLWN